MTKRPIGSFAAYGAWLVAFAFSGGARGVAADALDEVRARGELVWGGDREGGGPYIFADPADPTRLTGFEVFLAAEIAREMGVRDRFSQGPWDGLPGLLDSRRIDVILNGYELMPERAAVMEPTDPYYVYELQLLVRRGGGWPRSWEDLLAGHDGRRARVGGLSLSAAHRYLSRDCGGKVDVITYDGNTDAMREVETGKLDATLQDVPIAIHYRDRFQGLEFAGAPVGRGFYVLYVRKGEIRLRDEISAAIARLRKAGKLREIYDRFGIWTGAQESLASSGGSAAAAAPPPAAIRGWEVIRSRGPLLLQSAGMTVLLSVLSMPLAVGLGLLVALGRLYGPARLRALLTAYLEVLRGTPLLLQLYVIFFLLPEVGIDFPPIAAAVLGLAINYSAYEAEIYRAAILAVPPKQMEAALALGMTPGLALRRVILPQAARIALPGVTNDFIALFKDTSVCSVITVVELTKQYNIQRNDTGATLELAALTALLYLAMSLPLARLARRLEDRMSRFAAGGARA